MVRINRIGQEEGLECEILAKCEFFNAGGSIKDRIGRRMVLDAEKSGRIKPGDILIEPTSGNTGIGMALAAAVRGYKMIITLPEKMSREKVDVLKALGAEVIRTPTEAAFDAPESHIGVAKALQEKLPNAHILDQYSNPSNPLAHYDGTAEEIIQQCDGKLDVVVVAAGTGGTISGIARKFKEKLPHVKIVGVDPEGSILAQPEDLNKSEVTTYKVEGIGYDFIPKVLDRHLVDYWIKTRDQESFQMARRIIRNEGILCGGSSGAALWAAVQAAKHFKLTKEHRMVVIFPDSVRNYMSKFLSDDWMFEFGFIEAPRLPYSWADDKVSAIPAQEPVTVTPETTVADTLSLFRAKGVDQLPVVDADGSVVGIITVGSLMSKLVTGKFAYSSAAIGPEVSKQYRSLSPDDSLSALATVFEKDPYCLVIKKETVGDKTINRCVAVLSQVDLASYLAAQR